jgi:hypothetical protein
MGLFTVREECKIGTLFVALKYNVYSPVPAIFPTFVCRKICCTIAAYRNTCT